MKEQNASNEVIEGNNQRAGVADAVETNKVDIWKHIRGGIGNPIERLGIMQ